MTRKKIPNNLVYSTFYRNDNPNEIGSCWHCGKKLIFKNRGTKKKNGIWQIDHYPVPYRDLEDQIFIGIKDPLNPVNLVPSCVQCNLSHKYEISKWYYCNQSQFPCKKKFFKKICIIFSSIYLFAITILFLYCKYF